MTRTVLLGDREIGDSAPPFLVAELSGNHNQSLERAISIINSAAKTGADALKIQTYTPDTLTIDCDKEDFQLNDPESLWHGTSMYSLYQEAHTPWEWHEKIFEECRSKNILCFSTPFDITAVDFLESLNCPCYKIGSTENTDVQLLKKVAETGKTVIVSTGMATVEELGEMVTTLETNGAGGIILLKCTAAYPAKPDEANLLTIEHMKDLFGYPVGLSDHSLGTGVAVASAALGANMIEKHFTLSREDGGVDSAFSMEPEEFSSLVQDVAIAYKARGKINYGSVKSENSKLARRSLYIVKDIKKGEVLTMDNLKSIRPGYGLAVKHYDQLLGMSVCKDVERGTRMSWDLVKK